MGVEPYVLRYCETEFSEISPAKSKSQQRLYKRKDVERILKIKDLLYHEKFTIDGAKKRLKSLEKEEKEEVQKQQRTLFVEKSKIDKDFLKSLKGELEGLLQAFRE